MDVPNFSTAGLLALLILNNMQLHCSHGSKAHNVEMGTNSTIPYIPGGHAQCIHGTTEYYRSHGPNMYHHK